MPETKQNKTNKVAVRVFFVDEKSGNPVPGLVVNFSLDPASDADPRKKEKDSTVSTSRLLARAKTDASGYASVKLDLSTSSDATNLTISQGNLHSNALRVSLRDLLAGIDVYTIRVDSATLVNELAPGGLPAVTAPDCRDAIVSPGSIGLTPQLMPGGGLCSQLMPTTQSVRRFEAIQVLADICELQQLNCNGERIQFTRGLVHEYDINWHPLGTALGDLLNSITLAPCEQVNIAVADWMRRETATRTEAIDVQQQRFEQTDHDRLIVETMNGCVSKTVGLWAVAGARAGAAAGLSLSRGGVRQTLDLTAALGGGIGASTSTGIAAQTTNRMSERITQTASFVASERSSVVFQTTATEQHTYQSRTIRNHNHCHSLTMMYYQVNRNYCVVTEYKGSREVLLVKYDIKNFDAQRAYCNAEILKPALLDPELLACFDELGDALFCCDKPVGKEVMMDSVTITFKLTDGFGHMDQIQLVLNTTNGPIGLPWTHTPGWQAPGTYTQTFTLPGQVKPKDVTSVLVIFLSNGPGVTNQATFNASDVELTYHAVGYQGQWPLGSLHSPTQIRHMIGIDTKAEVPPGEMLNPCVEASCCIQKLLGHLNCHKRYYNSILWLNEDPNDRIMRWSCCGDGGASASLIAQIVNTPITVYGDFLVFPIANSTLVDDPSVLPVTRIVTMPTPGVYAEGILGQCDSCEIIDPDRRWDWKDSPCPDNAPKAPDPPTPQTGASASGLKPEAITSLISFSNVPSAPESIMKDLISTLLTHAEKGSADAKGMLDKLLDTIKASFPGKA